MDLVVRENQFTQGAKHTMSTSLCAAGCCHRNWFVWNPLDFVVKRTSSHKVPNTHCLSLVPNGPDSSSDLVHLKSTTSHTVPSIPSVECCFKIRFVWYPVDLVLSFIVNQFTQGAKQTLACCRCTRVDKSEFCRWPLGKLYDKLPNKFSRMTKDQICLVLCGSGKSFGTSSHKVPNSLNSQL